MPEQTTGSTVPRRQLGRYLRDLRQQQRLTVRSAADRLEWSEAKIWRIETGQVSLRSLDVEAMCKIYGAQADLTQALMGLAKETKARGWWHSYGDVIQKASTSTSALKRQPQTSPGTSPNSSQDFCRPNATHARSSRPTTPE
jgi:transcriptional regulator with XRE-family HTH domain